MHFYVLIKHVTLTAMIIRYLYKYCLNKSSSKVLQYLRTSSFSIVSGSGLNILQHFRFSAAALEGRRRIYVQ